MVSECSACIPVLPAPPPPNPMQNSMSAHCTWGACCRCDAWEEVNPGDPGYTYDGRRNSMLNSSMRSRLDRILCRLEHFQLLRMDMVGTVPVEGHSFTFRSGKQTQMMPSDHFGLLLTIRRVA
jgi:hypothetical protein